MKKWSLCLLIVLFGMTSSVSASSVRVGTVPVVDTLPLQVAVSERIFSRHDIDIELVPFGNTRERDAAMRSGRLQGYFGDVVETLMLINRHVPMRVVTVAYRGMENQRMFALLASPVLNMTSLQTMNGLKTGAATATITEYMLDRMRQIAKPTLGSLVLTDVPRVRVRFAKLLAGKLDLAILPEPWVTLAQHARAKILVTDETLRLPTSVIAFHEQFLEQNPGFIDTFLKAYREAVEHINRQPEKYHELMATTCRIPPPLLKVFPVLHYPLPELPDPKMVDNLQDWMTEHGLIQNRTPYAEIIENSQN